MRIALCTPRPLDIRLGAVKNRFEFAEALRHIGWETALLGYAELGLPEAGNSSAYRKALKAFITERGGKYNVVLYEYDTLPFARSLFPPTVLLVARPALLDFHHVKELYPLPLSVKWKNRVRTALNFRKLQRASLEKAELIDISLTSADLIQVQNGMDADAVRTRYPNAKIVVVPNGLSTERFESLSAPLQTRPLAERAARIAFVGTFDYRKGALDIRAILKQLTGWGLDCQLKLIGTKALFQSADEVLRFFPAALRSRIEVIETFAPEALPNLLSDCRVGLFPSYWESFGFGALEMMAAGLPVVAYTSPGPADFVPRALQVTPGDVAQATALLQKLLADQAFLEDLSRTCLTTAKAYTWEKSAEVASALYRQLLS